MFGVFEKINFRALAKWTRGSVEDFYLFIFSDDGQSGYKIKAGHFLSGVTTAFSEVWREIAAMWTAIRGAKTTIVFDDYAQLQQWLAGTYIPSNGLTPTTAPIGTLLLTRNPADNHYWWDGAAIQLYEDSNLVLDDYLNRNTDLVQDVPPANPNKVVSQAGIWNWAGQLVSSLKWNNSNTSWELWQSNDTSGQAPENRLAKFSLSETWVGIWGAFRATNGGRYIRYATNAIKNAFEVTANVWRLLDIDGSRRIEMQGNKKLVFRRTTNGEIVFENQLGREVLTINSEGNISICDETAREFFKISSANGLLKLDPRAYSTSQHIYFYCQDSSGRVGRQRIDSFATKAQLDAIAAITQGGTVAYVFDTTQQIQDWLDGTYIREDGILPSDLNIGNQLLTRSTTDENWWWDGATIQPLEVNLVLPDVLLKSDVLQETGNATQQTMSQKAITDLFNSATAEGAVKRVIFKDVIRTDVGIWCYGVLNDGVTMGISLDEPITEPFIIPAGYADRTVQDGDLILMTKFSSSDWRDNFQEGIFRVVAQGDYSYGSPKFAYVFVETPKQFVMVGNTFTDDQYYFDSIWYYEGETDGHHIYKNITSLINYGTLAPVNEVIGETGGSVETTAVSMAVGTSTGLNPSSIQNMLTNFEGYYGNIGGSIVNSGGATRSTTSRPSSVPSNAAALSIGAGQYFDIVSNGNTKTNVSIVGYTSGSNRTLTWVCGSQSGTINIPNSGAFTYTIPDLGADTLRLWNNGANSIVIWDLKFDNNVSSSVILPDPSTKPTGYRILFFNNGATAIYEKQTSGVWATQATINGNDVRTILGVKYVQIDGVFERDVATAVIEPQVLYEADGVEHVIGYTKIMGNPQTPIYRVMVSFSDTQLAPDGSLTIDYATTLGITINNVLGAKNFFSNQLGEFTGACEVHAANSNANEQQSVVTFKPIGNIPLKQSRMSLDYTKSE